MNEFVTKAVVLDVFDQGEADLCVILYTQERGKIVAKAKSARKINSRLVAHLQPLTLTKVRLVNKKGYQVVDALQERKTLRVGEETKYLSLGKLIEALTNEEDPDPDLWNLLESGEIASQKVLTVLGFDVQHATCGHCQSQKPKHFLIKEMYYVCEGCFKNNA